MDKCLGEIDTLFGKHDHPQNLQGVSSSPEISTWVQLHNFVWSRYVLYIYVIKYVYIYIYIYKNIYMYIRIYIYIIIIINMYIYIYI